jgi:D-glycero-alpha-D-manno-heptose-7-phosphate kinase
MIVTRAPLRISFFGGGTDYPEYFREHGGQTLGAAIDKYSYITVTDLAPLFDYTIRITYSLTELVSSIDEIKHPSVRECLRLLGLEGGLEIHCVGDLPARSGLGSSSSFTVALLHALHAHKGELVAAQQLAEEAVYVEREMIGERVGVQDQFLAAHGGLLHLELGRSETARVSPVPISRERLAQFQQHLMLFYTGVQRSAHEVLEEQMERTRSGAITEDLAAMARQVDAGIEILASDAPLAAFGDLLDSAWKMKRGLSSQISNLRFDAWYERAREAGAHGGKLLGAGGGGFFLLFVPPERHEAVRSALAGLQEVAIGLDQSGSRLIVYRQ